MKRDEKFWQGEAEYILAIDPARPGWTFECDPWVFDRYVGMQMRAATRDGYPLIARKMFEALRVHKRLPALDEQHKSNIKALISSL
mgnify:CR=1 FL=1